MPVPDTTLKILCRHRGFTLIEALVAFVILALGVIGIISLLLMSKNSLQQSNQRTLAVNLADTIVERIRINPAAADSYDTTGGDPLGGGTLPAPGQDCSAVTCDPAQLAVYDLWTWEQALDGQSVELHDAPIGGLIEPQACITFTPDEGKVRSGRLNVTIQWHGLSRTTDAVDEDTGVACGGADAGKDPHRRQVSVNTIVLDETEL